MECQMEEFDHLHGGQWEPWKGHSGVGKGGHDQIWIPDWVIASYVRNVTPAVLRKGLWGPGGAWTEGPDGFTKETSLHLGLKREGYLHRGSWPTSVFPHGLRA